MNTNAIKTDLSNAICEIRDRHNIKNKELFKMLFDVVLQFTPHLPLHDNRKFLVKKAKTRVDEFCKASNKILYLFNNDSLLEEESK